MRGDIKSMEELFQDCVERKNRIIRRLLGDLDESEEIYSTMLHTHMETIEKIIGIHQERLEYFRLSFEKEKKQILEQNKKEIENYLKQKEKAQRELEAVHYGLAEKAEASHILAEEFQLKKQDDFKNSVSYISIYFLHFFIK